MVRSGLLVAALCGATSAASAAGPRAASPRPSADELTALPAAGLPAGKALRAVRDVRLGGAGAPAAWGAFVAAAGGAWQAAWDRATGAPTRIWGSGILAPGAMASPDLAALYARAWLAAHVELLAPGAAASDFALVSNVHDGTIRAIGFRQMSGGRTVVGGQISFEFKRDRLFVIGSTALPRVTAPPITARLARPELRARAIAAVSTQLALPATARASALGAEVVVPLIGDDAILGYRVAAPITLDAGAAGQYLAYVDPSSGAPLAVRQQNLYETATLDYRGVDRYPARGRIDRPAPRAHVSVGSAPTTTGADGTLALPDAQTTTVTTAVVGDFAVVVNQAQGGAKAQTTLQVAPGGTATWDASPTPEADAQVVSYLAVNTVKAFIRDHVDAGLPKLNDALTANVNIDQQCNAFFDGTAVNFFASSNKCQNTGLIDDVMFHEVGHFLHANEIIDGVGAFDGAMSEGAADTLAVNITGDSGLGRGFFYTDEPLRELNPPDHEASFPGDIGEIHTTGLIFGGTWWDLRTALRDALGDDAGEALLLQLYVGALRRSIDIPTSLVEALATDDDDGDLSNGTPHECLIRDAYARHGMHTASGATDGPALLHGPFTIGSVQLRVAVTGLVDRCHSDDIDHVTVAWGDGPGGVPVAGSTVATQVSASEYYAQLPLPIDGPGNYSAVIHYTAGSTLTLPDNRADPRYEVYQAPRTIPLYCTDFEHDPFQAGWTTSAGSGETSPWAWAVPGGGASDPQVAYSGTHALMQAPGSDYAPNSFSEVRMPPIDVRPYSDVRLQYRRWLAVEDSHFDQARVTANGKQVWENATINMGDSSTLQHIDKEWRFQDIALSGLFTGPTVTVAWNLQSDGGLELGGWALDDVCVVANPESICGDGKRSFTEQCDDGAANADAPNACRTTCEVPRCGDGIVDSGEECDAGSAGDATCTTKCQLVVPDSGGCGAGGGAGWLALVGLLAIGRRRRSPRR